MAAPLRTVIAVVLSLVAMICAYIYIGEEVERQAWLKAPSTLSLYTTDEICRSGETGSILNCGHCGACSNRFDILVYNVTAQNLTTIMTQCAITGQFFGVSHTKACLQKNSNLSDSCASCWVQNAECNKKFCRRTCFHHKLLPFLPTWKSWDDPRLDPCITCDEKFCGPEFVKCAGANRRRVGVVSDLQRDMNLEMCSKTDWHFIMHGDRKDNISDSAENLATTAEIEDIDGLCSVDDAAGQCEQGNASS
mmetsp:Transcript_12142/g.25116  ORF Transcript_12142/g.25116 Transcript_12142/m.25116 type:complete len:250 (-) Transcript_12142:506-1255(-)